MLRVKGNPRPIPAQYDPRPASLRRPDPVRLEKLRTDLLQINRPFCLNQLLRAPVHVALHDHNYAASGDYELLPVTTGNATERSRLRPCAENHVDISLLKQAKAKFSVTHEQRMQIEKNTRTQILSPEWYAVRARRITGSKSGKILCQNARTVALLTSVLYSKPFLHLPSAIEWGTKHESNACTAYVKYMRSKGHKYLTTRKCGFIIHPRMGWLGASPDAFVDDRTSLLSSGIAEFKCPFSKKDVSPINACSDTNFYCDLHNGTFRLKRNHPYYHQVQLQLFVGADLYDWCDFCVYTTKGVAVERILLDTNWCSTAIPELESYFDAYMLPEIVNPMYKPSFVL